MMHAIGITHWTERIQGSDVREAEATQGILKYFRYLTEYWSIAWRLFDCRAALRNQITLAFLVLVFITRSNGVSEFIPQRRKFVQLMPNASSPIQSLLSDDASMEAANFFFSCIRRNALSMGVSGLDSTREDNFGSSWKSKRLDTIRLDLVLLPAFISI